MSTVDLKTFYFPDEEIQSSRVLYSKEDLNDKINSFYLLINPILEACSSFETEDKIVDIEIIPVKAENSSDNSLSEVLYDSLKDIKINKLSEYNYSMFDFESALNQPKLKLEISYGVSKTSVLVSNNNISINSNIIFSLSESKITASNFQGEVSKIKENTPPLEETNFNWLFGTNEAFINSDFKLNNITLKGTVNNMIIGSGSDYKEFQNINGIVKWTGTSNKSDNVLIHEMESDSLQSIKTLVLKDDNFSDNYFYLRRCDLIYLSLGASSEPTLSASDLILNGIASSSEQLLYNLIPQNTALYPFALNTNGNVENHFSNVSITDLGTISCSNFNGNVTKSLISNKIKFNYINSSENKYFVFANPSTSSFYIDDTIYENNGTIYGNSSVSLDGNADTTDKFSSSKTIKLGNGAYISASNSSDFTSGINLTVNAKYASSYEHLERIVSSSNPVTISYTKFILMVDFYYLSDGSSPSSKTHHLAIFSVGTKEQNLVSYYDYVVNGSTVEYSFARVVNGGSNHWYFESGNYDKIRNMESDVAQNVKIYNMIVIPLA